MALPMPQQMVGSQMAPPQRPLPARQLAKKGVYTPQCGGREGRLNGACHRSHSHCLSLYVFVCVSNADVRLPKKLKCYKNIIALVSDRDRELLNQAGPGQASAGHFESVLSALRMCGQGVRAVCCVLCAYSATAGKSIVSKSSRTTSQPSLMEGEGRGEVNRATTQRRVLATGLMDCSENCTVVCANDPRGLALRPRWAPHK